ncbi:tRNA (adenosine(37)-N6)-threonylcarbamoyltransferase complex dimerization subunit type 1 TsaB [Marinobacter caseinilyticus]|uniref:tRNA (adenosine(37)-N6)-threonylcarbamoyltransferase complex dimerization subunit type 1 TsaB n=1 Tax=Marinobacter caseinilyticus TaxID=2692195 RepID=UPI00140E29E3|nr:tRNA (adenosine(37)-N6)-threonylcarbamoyltransferase complex dimerization subunit type 1 TsaB [Marinobacter caseinilyticus]
MNLLALDTSSEGCSVALLSGGKVTDRFEIAPRGHTRLLMPMVKALLAERELRVSSLDAIAFAAGPGSFTGLRIATGVVQGLAFGLDIPVVPVSSLAVLAAGAARDLADGGEGAIAVAVDARMNEVYWGCFHCTDNDLQPVSEEQVCPPDRVSLPDGFSRWIGTGSGWSFRDQMPAAVVERISRIDVTAVPHARDIIVLAVAAWQRGRYLSAAEAQPVYLRNEVTWKKLPGR